MKIVLLLALSLTSCFHPPPKPCTCDNYPVPSGCESECPFVAATVKAINPANGTATIEINRNGALEQKQVRLSQLPPTARPGARINALLKVDLKTGQSTVQRFIPEVRTPQPAH
jgi:hypothetical protein